MPSAGDIWLEPCHYQDDDGIWHPKYLLILAFTRGGDIVYRVLTSRSNGRPKRPACYQGDPYASFYLGVLGGPLCKDSWVDLQYADDYDGRSFTKAQSAGALKLVASLTPAILCPVLACAIGAADTTKAQWIAMSNERQRLNCAANHPN
ncbi:hypothetical protein R69608_07649 [Paraburkholderia nemoris]|nr:hypothetical protein R69608_07649 [Paraburkholderia nemoris]